MGSVVEVVVEWKREMMSDGWMNFAERTSCAPSGVGSRCCVCPCVKVCLLTVEAVEDEEEEEELRKET